MNEFSLYVLDIARNSVEAEADSIAVTIDENCERLTLTVTDNGRGMTEEQLRRADEPFYSTRASHGRGMGIPLLKSLAEETGGTVRIDSVHESSGGRHGTTLTASFNKSGGFIPLGNIAETVKTLVQGAPDTDFTFIHRFPYGEVSFSCGEVRKILGGVSLDHPEILRWIGDEIEAQYEDVRKAEAQICADADESARNK